MERLRNMDVSGLSAYFFCGSTACLVGYRLLKNAKVTVPTMKTISRGLVRYSILIFLIVMGFIFTTSAKNFEDAPVVEKHNVRVIQRIASNAWLMSDDQGAFLYTACDDFPNDTVIWAGYVAKRVRWQEFGKCKSIRRDDLGFWWDRDENFDVRKVD